MDKAAPRTIDEYIGGCAPEVRARLQAIRRTIREAVPEAQEKISYQMPAFALRDILVYFAAWKDHISVYPIDDGMVRDIKGLSGRDLSGRGTVRFPHGEPLPLPLIRRIVKYREKQQTEKARAKAGQKAAPKTTTLKKETSTSKAARSAATPGQKKAARRAGR